MLTYRLLEKMVGHDQSSWIGKVDTQTEIGVPLIMHLGISCVKYTISYIPHTAKYGFNVRILYPAS